MVSSDQILDGLELVIGIYCKSQSFFLRDLYLDADRFNVNSDCATSSNSRLVDSLGAYKDCSILLEGECGSVKAFLLGNFVNDCLNVFIRIYFKSDSLTGRNFNID
jgi:hypothetical protein